MARRHRQSGDDPGVVDRIDGDWASLPVEPALSALVDLVEIHHGSGPMLEVGCGTGRTHEALMRRLVLRPYGYVGLDISPAMVDRARTRYPHADFRAGDLLALPFADGSFGSVVCTDVLQHLPELEAPLSQMLRVAREHVFLLLWLRSADGTDRHAESPTVAPDVAWSDEEVIAACRAGGGEVLDFLLVDGVEHDHGLVRVGVAR